MLEFSRDSFIVILIVMLLWEHYSPREALTHYRQRWLVNFSLVLINIVIKRLIPVVIALLVLNNPVIPAVYSPYQLLSTWLSQLSLLLFSVFIIDLFNYAMHRLFHHYKILWRTHSVHHSDLSLDVSTNFRHHPFEQLLSMGMSAVFLLLMHIPVVDLVIYGLIASAMQLWHHGNVQLPWVIEKPMRLVLVTPALHQLHHSAYKQETNSNYGTIFSFWDRFFGTLSLTKHENQKTAFTCGLEYFREADKQKLSDILKQPFK